MAKQAKPRPGQPGKGTGVGPVKTPRQTPVKQPRVPVKK